MDKPKIRHMTIRISSDSSLYESVDDPEGQWIFDPGHEIEGHISTLETALQESLFLQAHYAELLNDYDGGERISFDSPETWIARLKEIGKLKEK